MFSEFRILTNWSASNYFSTPNYYEYLKENLHIDPTLFDMNIWKVFNTISTFLFPISSMLLMSSMCSNKVAEKGVNTMVEYTTSSSRRPAQNYDGFYSDSKG